MKGPTRRKVKGFTDKEPGSGKKQMLLICLFLAVVSTCVFWQVSRSDFVSLDDHLYVSENSHVRNGLTMQDIRWSFAVGYEGNWHPLTWMSHMLDVEIFGLNPSGHHLTNLLFHIANAILLFLVLHRMTKALWQSAFVAALFALHPLHVESVAWVAERKDVLSTFFWILSMGTYTCYAERRSLGRYVALLVFLALGLMAKPMVVTLPFALLLLDYWPLHRFEQRRPAPRKEEKSGKGGEKPVRRETALGDATTKGQGGYHFRLAQTGPLLREKMPLFAMAALSSVITYLAQQKAGAVNSYALLPLGSRLENAAVSYCAYMGKMIWPAHLAVLYPHPGSLPAWQPALAVALLAGISVLVARLARKFPYLPSGWLWYLGTLVPVIGIVQIGSQARADRYTYIPLVGLFIIASWGISDLLKAWQYRKQALAALSAVILSCLSMTTWAQVGLWRNSITLCDHTLAVTSHNSVIHQSRGFGYYSLGDYARAIADFDRAIEIDPGSASAYYNRGIVYNAMRDYARAIADFDRAIEIDPGRANVYNNRGVAYEALGDYGRATTDFNRAIALDPGYSNAYYNRGVANNSLRNYEQAITDSDRAIALDPAYAYAYYNRGFAMVALGDYARAIADFDRAIEISPGYENAYSSRGATYNILHDYARAIADFDAALRINPKNAKTYYNRGTTYAMGLHDYARAITDLDRAIEINPGYADAYCNRGIAYNQLGNRSNAIADLTNAARLGSEAAMKLLQSRGERP